MRQDVTHFQLSALSNEDHVAKQPSISFHDNLLVFSIGWITLHCREGLHLYFLNGIMETISILHSLLFGFPVGIFSFLTRCQQVGGYIRRRNCPSGNAHEVGRNVSKRVCPIVFPKDRPLKQRPIHLSFFMRVFSRSVCLVITLPCIEISCCSYLSAPARGSASY